MNKFMYVVSPDYLMPIIQQSKDYSFRVKGFSDCSRAYNNLSCTNQVSILGYILVYDEIPEDSTDIVEFINFLNLIGSKDTIVLFSTRDPDGFEQLRGYLEVDNINFICYNDFEVLTDLVIRRNLFGSILIRKLRPYMDEDVPLNIVASYNCNSNIVPVLPRDILMILSPIVKYDNSKHTCDNDAVLMATDDPLIKYFRINRIKKLFDESVDISGMINRINSVDGVDVVLYTTIANMIECGF